MPDDGLGTCRWLPHTMVADTIGDNTGGCVPGVVPLDPKRLRARAFFPFKDSKPMDSTFLAMGGAYGLGSCADAVGNMEHTIPSQVLGSSTCRDAGDLRLRQPNIRFKETKLAAGWNHEDPFDVLSRLAFP